MYSMTFNRRLRRHDRLFVTDFEGTVTKDEMMPVIGEALGIGEYMRATTQMGMDGKIPFEESLRLRMQVLYGRTVEDLQSRISGVRMRKGIKEALEELGKDHEIAVISGGLYPLVDYLLRTHGIEADYIAGSMPQIEGGKITGVYPLKDKSLAMERIAGARDGAPYGRIVAMGDGANDAVMKKYADVFIWMEPKAGLAQDGDIVIEEADVYGLAEIARI